MPNAKSTECSVAPLRSPKLEHLFTTCSVSFTMHAYTRRCPFAGTTLSRCCKLFPDAGGIAASKRHPIFLKDKGQ